MINTKNVSGKPGQAPIADYFDAKNAASASNAARQTSERYRTAADRRREWVSTTLCGMAVLALVALYATVFVLKQMAA